MKWALSVFPAEPEILLFQAKNIFRYIRDFPLSQIVVRHPSMRRAQKDPQRGCRCRGHVGDGGEGRDCIGPPNWRRCAIDDMTAGAPGFRDQFAIGTALGQRWRGRGDHNCTEKERHETHGARHDPRPFDLGFMHFLATHDQLKRLGVRNHMIWINRFISGVGARMVPWPEKRSPADGAGPVKLRCRGKVPAKLVFLCHHNGPAH